MTSELLRDLQIYIQEAFEYKPAPDELLNHDMNLYFLKLLVKYYDGMRKKDLSFINVVNNKISAALEDDGILNTI